MISWKRGFLEIIGEILDNLMESPLKKTHITFRCNLDSRAVTKYLTVMIHLGLVEKSKKDTSTYAITQKGIRYREQFHSIISFMEKDLKQFQIKDHSTGELIADLKTKRQQA